MASETRCIFGWHVLLTLLFAKPVAGRLGLSVLPDIKYFCRHASGCLGAVAAVYKLTHHQSFLARAVPPLHVSCFLTQLDVDTQHALNSKNLSYFEGVPAPSSSWKDIFRITSKQKQLFSKTLWCQQQPKDKCSDECELKPNGECDISKVFLRSSSLSLRCTLKNKDECLNGTAIHDCEWNAVSGECEVSPVAMMGSMGEALLSTTVMPKDSHQHYILHELRSAESSCLARSKDSCANKCDWNDHKMACEISAAFAISMLGSESSFIGTTTPMTPEVEKSRLAALSGSLSSLLSEDVSKAQLSKIASACESLSKIDCVDECEWDEDASRCDLHPLVALRAIARASTSSYHAYVVAALKANISTVNAKCDHSLLKSSVRFVFGSIPSPCFNQREQDEIVLWFAGVQFVPNARYNATCKTNDANNTASTFGPFRMYEEIASTTLLDSTTIAKSESTVMTTTGHLLPSMVPRTSEHVEVATSTSSNQYEETAVATSTTNVSNNATDATGEPMVNGINTLPLLAVAGMVFCGMWYRQRATNRRPARGMGLVRGVDNEFVSLSGPE